MSRSPGLDSPSRASWAICRLLCRQVVPGLDQAFAHGSAGGKQFNPGTLGEALAAHLGEHPVRDAQLLAGVGPPALPAQPLAVAQPCPGQVPRHPGRGQPPDCPQVQLFGCVAVLDEGARPGAGAQRPGGSAGRRPLRETLNGLPREIRSSAPGGGLGEFVQSPGRHHDVVRGAGLLSRFQSLRVLAEAVVQDRQVVVGTGNRDPSPRACAPWVIASTRRERGGLLAAPCREPERKLRPDVTVQPLGLGEQQRGGGKFARLGERAGEVVQGVGKQQQRARRPGELDLTGRQFAPRLVVPQLLGGDVVGQAHPVQLALLAAVGGDGLAQGRRCGGAAVGQPGREPEQQQLTGGQGFAAERRGPGGVRDVRHVGAGGESAGVDRGDQRLEMSLTGEFGVQRLQPPGGVQQQPRGVPSTSHVECDLGAHALDLR